MILRIAAIKGLYALCKRGEAGEPAAAILCSVYPLRRELLEGMEVLPLAFDDFTDASRATAFQPEMARAVRDFVQRIQSDATVLYLCCDSGESRSAALCAAVLRWLGEKDGRIWRDPRYHPNPLVFRLQCAAFGVPVSRLGLGYRLWQNRRALARAGRRKA